MDPWEAVMDSIDDIVAGTSQTRAAAGTASGNLAGAIGSAIQMRTD
jgi:hypothetical protein